MKSPVKTEAIPVEFKSPRSLPKKFEIKSAHVPSENDAPINGVAIMGLGSEGRLPARAARLAAARGVTDLLFVQGLPFYRARPESHRTTRQEVSERLVDLAIQSTQAAAEHARDKHGAGRLHAIGESQGGAAVLETALRDPEALDGTIVLLHSLGTVGPLSRGEFFKRMTKSGLQPDQRSNIIGGAAVLAHSTLRVGQDFLRLGAEHLGQLDFALNYQAGPSLQRIREEQPERLIYVVTGSEDLAFPSGEQEMNLKPYGVENMLRVINGASHSPLAGEPGARQVVYGVQQWTQNALPSFVANAARVVPVTS